MPNNKYFKSIIVFNLLINFSFNTFKKHAAKVKYKINFESESLPENYHKLFNFSPLYK